MNNSHPKDHRKEGKQALLIAQIVAGLIGLKALLFTVFYFVNSYAPLESDSFNFYNSILTFFQTWLGLGSLVSLMFMCVWLYKIYKNMEEMDMYVYYNGYWLFLAWFIPIMNLYVPYQMMQDVHQGVQYMRNRDVTRCKSSDFLTLWWILLYVVGFFVFAANWAIARADYAEQPMAHTSFWAMLSALASVVTPILQIKFMQEVAQEEEETILAFEEGTQATETPY